MKRTGGERSRDLTISVMDKGLSCLLLVIKRMENNAASSRDYRYAQNYEKIQRLIEDIRKVPRRGEED